MLERAAYITSTGSSWAGRVESASFTLVTDPFERYLRERGWDDGVPDGIDAEDAKRAERMFPVHHPWWLRKITPGRWEQTKSGVQWRYKDLKPQDPIGVTHYLTQFPRLSEEVPAFVDRIRRFFDKAENQQAKLASIRETLLATWGKEPENASARAFAVRQVWYGPRKDFSMSDLSDTRRAVLTEFDARIAIAK